MYSIMLVEDESAVREGIVKKIDWQAHGFLLAGAFENGRQAADALEESPVDAVITDINMPVMDGLALARLISETSPQTVVVILTGFGDFSYAQTAIRYRVHEYILKPVTAKQLRELLDKLRAELDTRRAREYGAGYSELRTGVLRGVKELNRQSALESMDILIEHMLADCLSHSEYTLQLQKLAMMLTDHINDEKLELNRDSGSSGDILERLAKSPAITESRTMLRDFAGDIIEAGLSRGDSSGRQAALAVEYIKKHYADPDLSLQKITAYLSVSTSYFSGIFKSYTGLTFVDFLTRLRVSKAQELLASTDMKNYEIAAGVGYDDPGYFSSIFKKLTGKKPSDYRREYSAGRRPSN